MYFSKTTEYILRILIHLTEHPGKLFSAKTLHKDLDIPYKYVGHILTKMSQKELLDVTRGKHGGYKLSDGKEHTSVAQIIELFEENSTKHRCILGVDHCSVDSPCTMHKHWSTIRTTMEIKLNKIRISDLGATPLFKVSHVS